MKKYLLARTSKAIQKYKDDSSCKLHFQNWSLEMWPPPYAGAGLSQVRV